MAYETVAPPSSATIGAPMLIAVTAVPVEPIVRPKAVVEPAAAAPPVAMVARTPRATKLAVFVYLRVVTVRSPAPMIPL